MLRLFTALEIPETVAHALSVYRGGLHGARWIEPQDYHLTLHFIGEIDAGTAQELTHALSQIRRPAFDLALTGLEVFGGHRPRALYATVTPSQALSDLQADIERRTSRLHTRHEQRKFTPHVTLARLKGTSSAEVAEYLSHQDLFRPLTWKTTQFVMMSSRTSTGGGPYRLEQAWPLGGTG